jgi:hypothetical protein
MNGSALIGRDGHVFMESAGRRDANDARTLGHRGVADFGEVDQGARSEREILVNHAGSDDWRIVNASCPNPHLSVAAMEVSRGGGQVSYRVTVRLDPKAPPGGFAEHVVLETNDLQGKQVTLPVAGTVEPAISLSPSPLFMGLIEPGQKVTRQLVVRGRRPFQVSAITCDGVGFTLSDEDRAASKQVQLISVTFQAGREVGQAEGSIRVVTTIGTPPPVKALATVQSHAVAGGR